MLPIVHDQTLDINDFPLSAKQSKTLQVQIDSTGFFELGVVGMPSLAPLAWKLSDPDGRVILDYDPPAQITPNASTVRVEIAMATLDRVRDLAGYIRQPWTLQVTNNSPLNCPRLHLTPQIFEDIASSSAAPLLDSPAVALLPGVSQTFSFALNRLGQIRIDATAQPASANLQIELLDPSGSVVPLGTVVGSAPPVGTVSLESSAIGLLELHQAQKKGPYWSVRVSSSVAATCQITAQAYDTLTIPSSVLQNRLDALFGPGGTYLTLTFEHDTYPGFNTITEPNPAGGPPTTVQIPVNTFESFVCLTINSLDVAELFDSIGVLDALEAQDRLLRTPRGTQEPPPPVQYPLPQTGIAYRIYDLGTLAPGGHNTYLKNFETSSILINAGSPGSDVFDRLTFNVVFEDNPSLDIDSAPDLDLTTLSVSFDLMFMWQQDTKHIALVPQAPPAGAVTIGPYNWNGAPDSLVDAFDDPKSIIAGYTTQAISQFGAYLKTFTESLFFQLMGGLFDFSPVIQWTGGTAIFQFVAGEEDPVGALNPNYHFGPQPTMAAVATVEAQQAPLAPAAPTGPTPVLSALDRATVAKSLSVPGKAALPTGTATLINPKPPTPSPPPDGPGGDTILGSKPNWESPNLARIDHIVVLMKENRSFDHVLGHLSLTGNRPDVDGLTSAIINSFPVGSQPRPYPLVPVSADFPPDYFPFDPDHSFVPVNLQIDNPGGPPMHGFIPQFIVDYPWLAKSMDWREAQTPPVPANFMPFGPDAIMGYHTPATVPYYDVLAQSYTVCDRWFSSHPGPTFPNRFFFLSGKLDTQRSGEPQRDNGISGLTLIRHRNLFDELTARNISWTYYESPPDVTMLRLYARYAFDDQNIRPLSEFSARAEAGQLPSVTFIDPNFHYGETTNDDHPPTSITAGQAIMQQVVGALQTNRAAWGKTLFVFTYDEHGSIFDHVLPPIAEYLKDSAPNSAPAINIQYGVRVPAIVISPWVEKTCTHQIYDHCSILKTIIARFCPDDPPILSDRVAFAADLGPLLTRPLGSEILNQAQVDPSDTETGAIGPALSAAAVAPAKALAPLSRAASLVQPNASWHDFMARLKQMVKP